jgi:hypothetical protein
MGTLTLQGDEKLYPANRPYLFTHNLIALETMGIATVQQIWITDFDTPPEKQRSSYKVKIILHKKFFAITKNIDPDIEINWEEDRAFKDNKAEEKSVAIKSDNGTGSFDEISKVAICIDSKKGIYLEEKPMVRYGIRGKRFKIIKLLAGRGSLSLSDLYSITGRPNSLISKEIKAINRAFKKKLKLKSDSSDIIDHSNTSGFFLNEDDYTIELNLN